MGAMEERRLVKDGGWLTASFEESAQPLEGPRRRHG